MANSTIPKYMVPTGEWFPKQNWLTERERGYLAVTYDENTITINFSTTSRVHSENDAIFTIPQEFRPKIGMYAMCYCGAGYCDPISIETATGEAKLWVTPPNSGNTTIRGSVTYIYNAT